MICVGFLPYTICAQKGDISDIDDIFYRNSLIMSHDSRVTCVLAGDTNVRLRDLSMLGGVINLQNSWHL